MGKEKLSIPLSSIREGIELCIRNSLQFCTDAKALCKESSYNHALGLCLYAIEELGKADLLRELNAWAKKYGYTELILDRTKPEQFFDEHYHRDLEKLGFTKRMNPFFDHRLKLFYGRSLVGFATNDRLLRSLGDQKFQTFEQLIKAFDGKGKDSYMLDIKQMGFREVLMYVDFDQETSKWVNGVAEISKINLADVIQDIEKAIESFRSGLSQVE